MPWVPSVLVPWVSECPSGWVPEYWVTRCPGAQVSKCPHCSSSRVHSECPSTQVLSKCPSAWVLMCFRRPSARVLFECPSNAGWVSEFLECSSFLCMSLNALFVPECLIRCNWNKTLSSWKILKMFHAYERRQRWPRRCWAT